MKKKFSKKKIIIICLAVPPAIALLAVIGAVLSLVVSYHQYAYEKVPIVDRSNEYVEPVTDLQPEGWENVTVNPEDFDKEEPITLAPQSNVTPDRGISRNNSFGRSSNAINVTGKTPIYKVEQKDPDIENILIIGTDSRDVTKERGRSDALIIMSYNKKTGQIKMTSVLRDSLVPIEGHGWNRINAAYSFDGVGLAINTINEIFDLDIQRFVVIDFNGVIDFIDAVGGVTINLTNAEYKVLKHYFPDKDLKVGENRLDGELVLDYMRIRRIDSDFKRTNRQRTVISALANEILNNKSIPEIYRLTHFAFKLVKTNITATELVSTVLSIAVNSKGGINIENQHIPYSDAFEYRYYNGMAITAFDIEDAARRLHEFIYGKNVSATN